MEERKRILITGATSGIGKVAALELVKQGHHVIIHGRNGAKAEETRKEILAKVPEGTVDTLLADLTKKAEILALVETFNSRYDALDVLVNNAGGVMRKQREETAEGWEQTIAVNVLAPFMLSALLYPKMKTQPGARIVNTASMAHRMAKIDLSDLMYQKRYNAMKAYGDAKLQVILMGQEFARRQKEVGGGVTMNAFHPGVVATNFAGESDSFYHFFFSAFRSFLTTPEKGADTLIYLASHPDAGSLNGAYLTKRKKARVYGVKDPALAAQLWEQWEHYTGVNFGHQISHTF